jgi:hypothetical protein
MPRAEETTGITITPWLRLGVLFGIKVFWKFPQKTIDL